MYWYLTLGLLLMVGVAVAILDVVHVAEEGASMWRVTNERWNVLLGLIGLIIVFALYITLKRTETERLKADLMAQRDMAIRIETRTSELEGAIEQLTAIDRMKDSFLSTVSHEIRTPLTAIQSYSEVLMAREDAPPEIRAEFLGIINREARRLAVLINDLQDLARLEAGRVALHTGPCALRQLVDEALETAGILANEKGIHLTTDVPPDLPLVEADGHRMVRVLTNLIGNAVKFTSRGGSISLSARIETRGDRDGRGAACVHLTLRDTGRGIPAKDLPYVFDRFYRGGADDSNVQGTGLGLAISKEIIDRHNGELWVESAVGKGSTFHLRLPIAAAHSAAADTDVLLDNVTPLPAPSLRTPPLVPSTHASDARA
ncbi:MAG: sensor histidine kinase [bacterium]